MQTKPFFTSKTIIGAVMMLIGMLCQFYQINVPAADIATAGDQLTTAVGNISGLVGFGLTIYGRIRASGPISLSATKG